MMQALDENQLATGTHRTVSLSDIADVVSGVAKGRKLTGTVSEVPYLRVANVQDGFLNLEEVKTIPAIKAEVDRYRLLPGDVLLTEGGDHDKLGRGALWTGEIPDCIHQNHVFRVRVDIDLLLPEFLVAYLRSDYAKAYFLKCAKKTTNLASINMSQLKALPVPLPRIEEQRRWITIIKLIDGLTRHRNETLHRIDSLLESAFLSHCGDVVSNSKNWPIARVDSICKLVRGSSPRPKSDPRFYGGPVPRLMVADLTRDGWQVTPQIDSLTVEGAKLSRPVPAGTVVMAVSGNVGLTALLATDACIHDGFVAFTELNTSAIIPCYLMLCLHMLKITHANRQAGAIFQNLTTNDIKSMDIPMPPKEVQEKIEQTFALSQQLKALAMTSLSKIELFQRAVMQQIFPEDNSPGATNV